MWEFEDWKNEIIDSIKNLHEETKAIREHLEEEKEEETENNFESNVVEGEEEEEEVQITSTNEDEILILEKFDEIYESINALNKSVVEGSIVISVTIVLALAFHYLVNQLSKW